MLSSQQQNQAKFSNISTAERAKWLEAELERLKNSLRTGQKGLANWRGGEMAVSAVPGAGSLIVYLSLRRSPLPKISFTVANS